MDRANANRNQDRYMMTIYDDLNKPYNSGLDIRDEEHNRTTRIAKMVASQRLKDGLQYQSHSRKRSHANGRLSELFDKRARNVDIYNSARVTRRLHEKFENIDLNKINMSNMTDGQFEKMKIKTLSQYKGKQYFDILHLITGSWCFKERLRIQKVCLNCKIRFDSIILHLFI